MPISAARAFAYLAIGCGGCDRVFDLTSRDNTVNDASREGPIQLDDALTFRYDMAVLQDVPIAYFKLDETSGPFAKNEIADGSGGKYFGPHAFGEPGPITSQPNTSIAFGDASATSSGIDLGDNFSFAGAAPFTVETWVQAGVDSSPEPTLLAKLHADGGGWILYLSNTYVGFRRSASFADGSDAYNHDLAPDTTRWRHIVATYDGLSARVFVDGAGGLATSSSQVLPGGSDGTVLVAGTSATSDTAHTLRGHLDNIAIYDTALTPFQISAHFLASQ